MKEHSESPPAVRYGRAQGVALLEQVVAETGPLFTSADAVRIGASLGLARPDVNGLLAQLAQGQWLARLKRGVYAVQSPLLSTDLHPFALAAAWWSFSDAMGLTQAREMRKMDARQAARRQKAVDDLGLGSRRKKR